MIQLSDHFTYRKLLKFAAPSIVMMIFTSIYGIVDGFFVSNFAGKTPFAAVNFIMPVLMILGCLGFMFGTGGSALISMIMGTGDEKKANETFSLIIYTSIVCGIVLLILGMVFLPNIAEILGADGEMLENCVRYGRIVLLALPFYILQYEFQCLFAAAEKPKFGLYVTVVSGIANMVLDALFVGVFSWGIAGAAAATAASQFVGGIIPLIYFARPNTSRLRLGKCHFDGKALKKTCANGSSELMSNISMSVVSMLYNFQLMKYEGENGIAVYGVLMYVSMIFQAVYIGYAVGTAPITSYHYGAGNKDELKGLVRKGLTVVASCAFFMFGAGELLAGPLAKIFVGYDANLQAMTVHAFRIFSFSFLFSGFNIYGSSFFTALNNGAVSALIAFLRTLVFQAASILIFPLIWQLDGIWMSIAAAEILAAVVTAWFLKKQSRKYGYA